MRKLSLKFRIFSAALLALLFFIPLAAYALERAYVASLGQAMLERMRVQTLTLISEFELYNNASSMPEVMINGQFNIPESGLYGLVSGDDVIIWKSLSSMNWAMPRIPSSPEVGQEQFLEITHLDQEYFLHSYTAEFLSQNGFQSYTFHVFQDRSSFNIEVIHYRTTLWYWLGIIAFLLLALLTFAFFTALRPIDRLVKEISRIEKGDSNRITDQYPAELERLKSNLNHLLNTEENQRQRYKNSLGDLAHSLKTPLAVLSGIPELPEQGRAPVEQINSIIQRQLKRAVAGTGSRWNQKCAVSSVAIKLVNAMEKVYRDAELDFDLNVPDTTTFYGDETDLLELLGNLIDNACKAAVSFVYVYAEVSQSRLRIGVADDGPGIAPSQRQLLIERGKRLDSYQSGQGIGMAVVADLVSAYEGQLYIGNGTDSDDKQNPLSRTLPKGAHIYVDFPLPNRSVGSD